MQAGGNQLTDDRHPLPVAVEVQDGQDIVGPLDPHLAYGDGVLCSGQENVPEVPRGRHQGPLVRGSCLVIELTCRIAARTQLRGQLDTAAVHTEDRDQEPPSLLHVLPKQDRSSARFPPRIKAKLHVFYLNILISQSSHLNIFKRSSKRQILGQTHQYSEWEQPQKH